MDPARAVFHIGIVLTLLGPITADQARALKFETADIWRPYGVAITWFEPAADCGSHDQAAASPVDWMLRLVTDTAPSSDVVLGTVRFREGIPDDTIHLLYAPLSQMVRDATIGSWSIGSMPPPLRDRLIGQALGRVVAHELGHVLLALPSHARSGLMRPTFIPSDLVRGGRDQLRLSRTFVERLDRRLSGLAIP